MDTTTVPMADLLDSEELRLNALHEQARQALSNAIERRPGRTPDAAYDLTIDRINARSLEESAYETLRRFWRLRELNEGVQRVYFDQPVSQRAGWLGRNV